MEFLSTRLLWKKNSSSSVVGSAIVLATVLSWAFIEYFALSLTITDHIVRSIFYLFILEFIYSTFLFVPMMQCMARYSPLREA